MVHTNIPPSDTMMTHGQWTKSAHGLWDGRQTYTAGHQTDARCVYKMRPVRLAQVRGRARTDSSPFVNKRIKHFFFYCILYSVIYIYYIYVLCVRGEHIIILIRRVFGGAVKIDEKNTKIGFNS